MTPGDAQRLFSGMTLLQQMHFYWGLNVTLAWVLYEQNQGWL